MRRTQTDEQIIHFPFLVRLVYRFFGTNRAETMDEMEAYITEGREWKNRANLHICYTRVRKAENYRWT